MGKIKAINSKVFTIETRRFRLRPLTREDVTESYLTWWNDTRLQSGFNSPVRNWDLQQAREHMAKFDNKTRFQVGVFDRASDDLIGFVSLFFNLAHQMVLGNFIVGNRRFWGRRVGQEAGNHLMKIVFEDLNMEKAKVEIHGNNKASVYLAESLGFTLEGELRNELAGINGGRVNVYVYGILREEWMARKGRKDHGVPKKVL